MKKLALFLGTAGIFAAVLLAQAPKKDDKEKPKIPELKFNDVVEIAPGVFFRYASISATDPKVPFGGCNNIWIVCKEYVVVIDANFPKEAADVLADIKKTTKLPIKYVLDTHHHGDHAYGNSVWVKEGAKIIASKNCQRLLKANGPKAWEDAAKDRKDVKESELKQVEIAFDEKYIIDDGVQRIEFYAFGHSHTAGDAVAYLPKHKLLCTGDACVNGSFNYMGHSNSAAWIQCLTKMEKLEVDIVCPGHGKPDTKDLLARQKRYFSDLRDYVKKGIDGKKSFDDIVKEADLPWYKEWTGKAVTENKDNLKHVFDELSGKIEHDRLGSTREPLDWKADDQRPVFVSTPNR